MIYSAFSYRDNAIIDIFDDKQKYSNDDLIQFKNQYSDKNFFSITKHAYLVYLYIRKDKKPIPNCSYSCLYYLTKDIDFGLTDFQKSAFGFMHNAYVINENDVKKYIIEDDNENIFKESILKFISDNYFNEDYLKLQITEEKIELLLPTKKIIDFK